MGYWEPGEFGDDVGDRGDRGDRGGAGAKLVARCASARPGRRTSRVAFAGDALDDDDPLLGFPPYVHRAPRRNSITPARQRAFISALAGSGIVTQAARAIGASLEALYKLRRLEGAEGFACAWDMAVERGLARLEDCALERAIAGEERPIVRGGEVVAVWRRYDTALLVFLLRQRRAERYNDGRFVTRTELRAAERAAKAARDAEGDDEPAAQARLLAKLDRIMAAAEAEAAAGVEAGVDAGDSGPDDGSNQSAGNGDVRRHGC